jgi:ABC-2 type transport system ATP-binding protein
MNVIEFSGVTKNFRHTKALNNLSFSIEGDKITGLIGRNGAGKTTLLKMIAGFIKQTSGEVKVFSEKPFNNLMVSANTIFIHENLEPPVDLNLMETLDVSASFYENWNHELAVRLFEYFSLNPKQTYSGLSMGMKSTFKMIIGIASRCKVTIFDEPTTGMDAAVRKDFYRVLLKDYIAYPRTIIISSHHLDEIEELLEDILLIKNGQELLHLPIVDLKEWAIGLQGKRSLVQAWVKNREVLHMKNIGVDSMYVAVQNNFSEMELQKARMEGMNVSPVTVNDLCIYLTGETEGGIDDVFIEA